MSNDIQAKINNVVDLYEDRKIAQVSTANNLIDGLTAKGKQREKGIKAYENAITKHQDKERVSEKQTKALEKAREIRQIKVKLRKATDKEREGLSKFVSKVKETFKDPKYYSVKYILFGQAPNSKKTGGVVKDGIRLYPIWTNPPYKIANIRVNSFIEGLVKRLVPKWEKPMFERMVMIMSTDDTFKTELGILDYVDAIRIESIEDVSDTSAKDMNIREERLRESAEHFSIYHRYIETEVDTDYYTVKEAIENKSYKENECWINSLNEHYEGTELMREKRGKLAKTLSREKVLELIKTSDDYIEKGATINQMENVFQHFNIPVRLYNFRNEIIYRYDPEARTRERISAFNALVKNNHIYTLNFNLKSLYQKNQIEKCNPPSHNYYINDREKPVRYMAFNDIDEFLKLTDEEQYNLIQVDNDLVKTLYQLKSAKYEPFVKYQLGMLSEIKVRLRFKKLKKTIVYNIVAQNLSKQSLHCEVIVKSDDKYNKMTEAMFYFNKIISKEGHKSRYSEVDVKILNECRTIVPIGYLKKQQGRSQR